MAMAQELKLVQSPEFSVSQDLKLQCENDLQVRKTYLEKDYKDQAHRLLLWRKPCSPFYKKVSETDGPSGLAETESFIVGKDQSLGILVQWLAHTLLTKYLLIFFNKDVV